MELKEKPLRKRGQNEKKDKSITATERALRLFLKFMADGKRHYLVDLAEQFNCSRHAMTTTLCTLEGVLGTSLETGVEDRKIWYRLMPIRERYPLPVKLEEIRFLSICRDLASSTLPEQVLKRVDESIFQFSLLLEGQEYNNRGNAQKRQLAFFPKGRIDYRPHIAALGKLIKAAEEKLACLIRYKAPVQAVAREHRFAPGYIAAMNNAFYVIGAGLEDDMTSYRRASNFAVHRIQDVTLTDKRISFELPEPDTGKFGLPWHEAKKLRIWFEPGATSDYVRERIWSDEQTLEEQADGSLVLEITTRSEKEVTSWVLGFGDKARILE